MEKWLVEDAIFLTKMTSQWKPEVLEKCVRGLPDANRWSLAVLCSTGGPRRTRRCKKPTTSAFYWHLKVGTLCKNGQKYQKWPFWIDDCEGPTGRTVIYQLAEPFPTGWEHFYTDCDAGRRRQHLFSENPSITVSPGLGSLTEISQCVTMRCARAEWWTYS